MIMPGKTQKALECLIKFSTIYNSIKQKPKPARLHLEGKGYLNQALIAF